MQIEQFQWYDSLFSIFKKKMVAKRAASSYAANTSVFGPASVASGWELPRCCGVRPHQFNWQPLFFAFVT